MGFDFCGTYTVIEENRVIEYKLDDNRKVWVTFEEIESGVVIKEAFEAEDENSAEMQKQGWQAILKNFKRHVEGK